jgi:2,3,4,5-tetrahydropyridine-2-carboxylate N-succinyltransferase
LSLQATIEALAAAGAGADRAKARAAFDELKAALEKGSVRSAEPDPSSPTGWRVNTWVKQGILLGFKFGDIVDQSAGLPFYDKDTQTVQRFTDTTRGRKFRWTRGTTPTRRTRQGAERAGGDD